MKAMLLLLGITVVLGVACGSGGGTETPAGPTPTPTGAPYGRLMHEGVLLINWGWSSPEPEIPAQFADVIVQGKVVRLGEPRWTTPDGERPEGSLTPYTSGYTIYDRATVEVTRVIAGDGVPDTINVTSWGGRRDGVSAFNVDAGPSFAPEQEVLLFLYEPGKDLFTPRENWSSIQAYQVFGDMAWHGDRAYLPMDELLEAIATARAVPLDQREYQPGWRFPGTGAIDQAAVYADAIVRGKVTRMSDARWSTADGKAPEGYDPRDWQTEDNQYVYQLATVEVEDATAGRPPHTLTVVSYGGTVDGLAWPPEDDSIGRPYAPVFAAGEEVVLFLLEPGRPLVRPNEHWMSIMDWRVEGARVTSALREGLRSREADATMELRELIAEARAARRAAVPPVR